MLIGNLAMADGPAYVTVRAVNNAKEMSEVAIQIGVDTARPYCTQAIGIAPHPPGHLMVYTEEQTTLSASWSCVDAQPWAHVPLSCVWAVGSFGGGDCFQIENDLVALRSCSCFFLTSLGSFWFSNRIKWDFKYVHKSTN